MSTRVIPDIEYPSSDGKPMAETGIHARVLMDVIQMLVTWFAARPRVWAWGNMFLYYVQGDASKNVAPDVMVVKGVDKNFDRDVFKVWAEKRSPCAIIEITSRKTRRVDEGKKFELYRDVLKVHEYFLFDPRGEYLDPPLKGYRLSHGVSIRSLRSRVDCRASSWDCIWRPMVECCGFGTRRQAKGFRPEKRRFNRRRRDSGRKHKHATRLRLPPNEPRRKFTGFVPNWTQCEIG